VPVEADQSPLAGSRRSRAEPNRTLCPVLSLRSLSRRPACGACTACAACAEPVEVSCRSKPVEGSKGRRWAGHSPDGLFQRAVNHHVLALARVIIGDHDTVSYPFCASCGYCSEGLRYRNLDGQNASGAAWNVISSLRVGCDSVRARAWSARLFSGNPILAPYRRSPRTGCPRCANCTRI